MRRVTSLDVSCPACGASPGMRCYKLDGSGETSPHPKRRERSAAEQARLNPEHVRGQLPLWGKAAS